MGSFAICLSNLDIDLLTKDVVNMLSNCGINYCCVYSPSNGQNSLNHRVPHSWGSSSLNQPSSMEICFYFTALLVHGLTYLGL